MTILDGGGTVVDTVTSIVANEAWSVSLSAAQAIALADGSDTVMANVTDIAGNPAQAIRTLTVDETAPSITIGTIADNDILKLAAATVGFAVSGTAPGAENRQPVTVTIVDGGGTVVDTITGTVSGGARSASVSSAEGTALVGGSYTVTANVTDVAGNLAAEARAA